MSINWTSIIIAVILAGVAWFLPNPFTDKECPGQTIAHTTDTIKVLTPYPVFSAITKVDTVIIPLLDEPYLIEKTTEDSTQDGTTFKFTSRTLLEARGDTIYAETTHKWDVQPRPLETLVIKDTVKTTEMVEVEVPSPVPFYENPAVVATVTAIATAILVKILLKE